MAPLYIFTLYRWRIDSSQSPIEIANILDLVTLKVDLALARLLVSVTIFEAEESDFQPRKENCHSSNQDFLHSNWFESHPGEGQ